MNAIISRGDKTAHVQLPVGRKQLSGALSYLGANHTSDYRKLKIHKLRYKHGADTPEDSGYCQLPSIPRDKCT